MWQHLPEKVSPYILETPWFRLHWYGFMYVAAYVVIYILARYRMKTERFAITRDQLLGVMTWSIIGLAVGARLFYVLFYDPVYFFAHPHQIIWPFGAQGDFTGIAGFSYHGGLVGIIIAVLFYCNKRRIRVWELVDFLIPIIPLGFTFGRIGNFINGELYGRVTSMPWGMYFPRDPSGLLRHPSQLYEACLEGVLLFVLLWTVRMRVRGPKMLALYLIGYAVVRFFVEFFREPDPQLGLIFGPFTMGQVFSFFMAAGAALLLWHYRNKASENS